MPILQDSLSGAFGSVRLCSTSPTYRQRTNVQLIWSLEQTIHELDYEVSLEAYIQHHTFSLDMGLGSGSDRQLRIHMFYYGKSLK